MVPLLLLLLQLEDVLLLAQTLQLLLEMLLLLVQLLPQDLQLVALELHLLLPELIQLLLLCVLQLQQLQSLEPLFIMLFQRGVLLSPTARKWPPGGNDVLSGPKLYLVGALAWKFGCFLCRGQCLLSSAMAMAEGLSPL